MTKNTSKTGFSSNARNGGGRRLKRPRSDGGNYDSNNDRGRERAERGGDSDQGPKHNNKINKNKNISYNNRSNSNERLYHGVCPDVSNRYRKVGGGRIGQGTYGVVYCARDVWKKQPEESSGQNRSQTNKKTNEIVALKKCYAHHEASDGFPVTTLREIQALRICSSHPNIVDLLEIAVSGSNEEINTSTTDKNNKNETDNNDNDDGKPKAKDTSAAAATQTSTVKIGKSNVFLVFEHCRYDLAHILDSYHEHRRKSHRHRGRTESSSPFSLPQTKTLTLQLLSALEFCHSHWLVHRDIKPSNLLYDTTTGRLKVCDFGLSRIVSDSHMTPNVVSLWYRAPELLLSDNNHRLKYSFPIDLWATGCVLAELLKGRPFLDGTTEVEQLEKMQDALGTPPRDIYSLPSSSNHHRNRNSLGLWDRFEYLPPEGLTLLVRLLDYDPDGRWKAAKALQSDFLAPTSVPAPIRDLGSMPRGFPGC